MGYSINKTNGFYTGSRFYSTAVFSGDGKQILKKLSVRPSKRRKIIEDWGLLLITK